MRKLSAIAIYAAFISIPALLYSFKTTSKIFDTIKIEPGLISGIKSDSSDVIAYKGIPYAAPPVGNLRWKAPQPAIPWQGVKQCDNFGPSPMQAKPVSFMVYTREFLIPEQPISEDCLYLNVWTKAKHGAKKPVFVWIYGGGFGSGGTAVPIYDGEAMAQKGVIFVSVNYRVGVFGFMAHPELTKESGNNASGNYGLLDQIAALQWIKRNITAFGGDPDNVTIAGQSAGSISVNCLVASPVAKGLFNKAIAESGSFLIDLPSIKANDLKIAEQQGIKVANAVHATTLDDLRRVPAEDLMKVPERYSPIVDGYVLSETVAQIFAEGKQNNVSLLTGWNADESFISSFQNKDAFTQQAKEQYGADADEFLKYYPANTDEEAARSQVKLSRDMTFALSGFKWASLQSSQGKAPVYVYYFARKLPATAEYAKYGAFHTGEVAYVMNNLKFLDRPWKLVDNQLARLMSSYWVNFATNGNPNGKGLPVWPQFNTQSYQAMVFDSGAANLELPDKDELVFMLKKAK
ncbi:carboxylesterase/lipase family protein [Mucilaginibacter sp. X4EP1]|uniref:carboxylesterase/lipase family protein n=1 Tax=Mucilaginibacter sp. X4EP1 TaxID=2723092 RepID=UPI0021692CB6|nr:carboxylesterase family protein [Mucilaginibacter sp. X4EP1]MCS3815151.1 para-nitrobenzyl esterase [Mucilaginibacter sp. X4EP1]